MELKEIKLTIKNHLGEDFDLDFQVDEKCEIYLDIEQQYINIKELKEAIEYAMNLTFK